MSYHQSICKAGRTKEYNLYYSIRHNDGKIVEREKRAEKKKPTSEKQAAINRKRAEITLTRVMNANFGGRDLYITFDWEQEKRPATAEEFQKQAKWLLRKLRKVYKAADIPCRYIWVAERGERGAAHIHMVISGIEFERIRNIWPYGYMTIKPLDPSGSYHKLASYFMKYSDKTMKTEGRLQGKRYNASKNLVHPEPEKVRIRKKRRFDPEKIDIPAGWYLDQDTVEFGVQANGYEFLRYTLVMISGYKERQKKNRAKKKKASK